MQLTLDESNKRLVFELTDEEFDALQTVGAGFISSLENRMTNILSNEESEYKVHKRREIESKVSIASTKELVAVLDVLNKPKP